jgi:hypothetical protein
MRKVLVGSVLAALVASCGGGSQGMPGGPMPDAGPAPSSLTISAPYTLAAGQEVTYQCMATTVHFTGTAYINAFTPHTPQGVHHLVLFIDHTHSQPEGEFPCAFVSGGPLTPIYAAGINANPTVFPTGVGYPLQDGDQLVLQVHELNAGCNSINGTAGLDVGLAPPGTQITPAQVSFVGNVTFTVPMGAAGYQVNGQCSHLPAGTNVFAVFPHMHQIGASINVSLDTPSGPQTLANVTPWRFTEQPVINVSPIAQVAAGGRESVTCTYNNTTNQPVSFGQSSTDEMCFAITYFYPAAAQVPEFCIN